MASSISSIASDKKLRELSVPSVFVTPAHCFIITTNHSFAGVINPPFFQICSAVERRYELQDLNDVRKRRRL